MQRETSIPILKAERTEHFGINPRPAEQQDFGMGQVEATFSIMEATSKDGDFDVETLKNVERFAAVTILNAAGQFSHQLRVTIAPDSTEHLCQFDEVLVSPQAVTVVKKGPLHYNGKPVAFAKDESEEFGD